MTTWLIPRSELTVEQLRAIELPHTEHQIILGAPGSGKTQVLLHRADELRRRLRVPDGRFCIFVYTNVLKTYVRSALDLLGLPEETVTTFDDWCKRFYERHISRRLPWDPGGKMPDFEAIRRSVAQFLAANPVPLPLYDFALVDEGQDLDMACFEILRRIARHVTVCLDYKQQIYDRGSSEQQIMAALGVRRRKLWLLDAYRCSPYVARLAARVLEDPAESERYLRQLRTDQTERETPLLYEATSFEDEKRRLIEVLCQRLLTDQRIGVLFPLRRQVFGFAKSLAQAGIDVETQDNLDFSSSRPKLITFHSAKGLTFDSVLLPRLVVESFPGTAPNRLRCLLFVAITRATRWVYLSTVAVSRLPLLQTLKPLASEGVLALQGAGGDRPGTGATSQQTSDGLDFL
ncbi:MAG: hypothetical protein KatS3mg015_3125 [Fimbriimonadales bacterium]|nr:MAG: hypothetical protein KatS3mg015_3125 [Fimbriimonadales bacterium]